jgi:hypothetical protein
MLVCLIATLKKWTKMNTLPVELQALILTADFATWTAAVQTLRRITVQPYVQSYAKQKFLYSHTNSIGTYDYLLMDDMSARHGKFRRHFTHYGENYIKGRYHRSKLHGIYTNRILTFNTNIMITQWYFLGVLDGSCTGFKCPTVVTRTGTNQFEHWYKNGKLHRPRSGPNSGPAVTKNYGNGMKEMYWYKNGKLHRPETGPNSGPAVWVLFHVDMLTDGYGSTTSQFATCAGNIRHAGVFCDAEEWWQNDEIHRIDGPAVRLPDNSMFWLQNNVYHREDGPAVLQHSHRQSGAMEWWQHGARRYEFNQPVWIKDHIGMYIHRDAKNKNREFYTF